MLGGRADRKGGCGNTGSCCTSLMEGSSTTCVLQLSSSTKSLSLLSTCNRKYAFLPCTSCRVNTSGAKHDLMPCALHAGHQKTSKSITACLHAQKRPMLISRSNQSIPTGRVGCSASMAIASTSYRGCLLLQKVYTNCHLGKHN